MTVKQKCRNCVWGTPARDSCFRKYNRQVDLQSMHGVYVCVPACQGRLESKWKPSSLVELTRSIWPVVVWMSGRLDVMEGG